MTMDTGLNVVYRGSEQIKTRDGCTVCNFTSEDAAKAFSVALESIGIVGGSGNKKFVGKHIEGNPKFGVVLTREDVNKLHIEIERNNIDYAYRGSEQINTGDGCTVCNFLSKDEAVAFSDALESIGIVGRSGNKKFVGNHIEGNPKFGVVLTREDVDKLEAPRGPRAEKSISPEKARFLLEKYGVLLGVEGTTPENFQWERSRVGALFRENIGLSRADVAGPRNILRVLQAAASNQERVTLQFHGWSTNIEGALVRDCYKMMVNPEAIRQQLDLGKGEAGGFAKMVTSGQASSEGYAGNLYQEVDLFLGNMQKLHDNLDERHEFKSLLFTAIQEFERDLGR